MLRFIIKSIKENKAMNFLYGFFSSGYQEEISNKQNRREKNLLLEKLCCVGSEVGGQACLTHILVKDQITVQRSRSQQVLHSGNLRLLHHLLCFQKQKLTRGWGEREAKEFFLRFIVLYSCSLPKNTKAFVHSKNIDNLLQLKTQFQMGKKSFL